MQTGPNDGKNLVILENYRPDNLYLVPQFVSTFGPFFMIHLATLPIRMY